MLDLRDVSVRYGRTMAVDGCSLQVAAGEAVALLGANGAGKTTMLRAISRLVPVTRGTVSTGEVDLTSRRAHQVLEAGVVHVPEGRGIFPEMSVAENLRMGGYRLGRAECEDGVELACSVFPRLRERFGQKSWSLSGGEQQMLAVGRALVARPRVLLLDEISLGLSPRATAELYNALATIRGGGISLLVVEQQAHLALANTERFYVLRQGTIVFEGRSSEHRSDPGRIWEAYVGAPAALPSTGDADRDTPAGAANLVMLRPNSVTKRIVVRRPAAGANGHK
jgi:branched-chain amino acid transport system ATP-binding protein